MTKFFYEIAAFFAGLYRAIIWFVLLVALLLVAYCAVRAMDMAYDYVNDYWFESDDSFSLILAAAILMAVGVSLQIVRHFWRRGRRERPDRGGPLVGPRRDGQG